MRPAQTAAAATTDEVSDRVWSVPNALSMLRIACVPLFLWLVLNDHDGWALLTLVLSGLSDYLDGRIARGFHQVTRFGQLLDPIADRLYIAATLLGLVIRGILPLWLVVVLVLRDVIGLILVQRVRAAGYRALPTNFLGRAATFCLLYAFPLLLLAEVSPSLHTIGSALGWAFGWWGTVLYWLSMAFYVRQGIGLIRAARQSG